MATKHAEIYNSLEELNAAVAAGILVAPYIAYVVDAEGNKQMYFSSDSTIHPYEQNIAEAVMSVLNDIRNGEVYCTEEEYNKIIKQNEDGTYNECTATQPDGTTKIVTFDANVKYYVYE